MYNAVQILQVNRPYLSTHGHVLCIRFGCFTLKVLHKLHHNVHQHLHTCVCVCVCVYVCVCMCVCVHVCTCVIMGVCGQYTHIHHASEHAQ